MNAGQESRLALVTLLLTSGLFISLGVVAHSIWVPVCCFVGVVLLGKAGFLAARSRLSAFYVLASIGMGLVGVAAFGSHFAGRWLWTPIGLLLFLNMQIVGAALRHTNASAARAFALLISFLCAVFGIVGPWLLYGSTPSALLSGPGFFSALSFDIGRGLGAMKAVLAIRSPWGFLYLMTLCFLGFIWKKRAWSYLLTFAAILAAVGLAAALHPQAQGAILHVLTSSPVALMRDVLFGAGRRCSSPGWCAVLTGFVLPAVLFPAIRENCYSARVAQNAGLLKQAMGTTVGALYLRRAGGMTPFTLLASLLTRLVTIGLVIAVWMALRDLASSGAAIPFGYVPDITVPHWRPVWHYSYIALAASLGAISFGLLSLKRLRGIPTPMAGHPFLVLISAMLLGLVAPAGVILFLSGLCVGWQTIAIMVDAGAMPVPVPAREEVRKPPVTPRPQPMPLAPRPWVEPQPVEEMEPEARAEPATLLFTHSAPIVDLAVTNAGGCIALDSSGSLISARGKSVEGITKLDLASPLGLASLPGGKIAVVDGDGRILIVTPQGAGSPKVDEIRLSSRVHCFAVNGFGTIMTFSDSGNRLSLALLSSRKEQLLIEGLGDISALAYSTDSVRLAVGTIQGEVHIIDMTSRRAVSVLRSSMPAPSPVVALIGAPEARWIAAYENRFIGIWSAEGKLERSQKMRCDVFCLAFDPASGKIAHATNEQQIHVLSPDLRITFVVPPTEQEDIVKLIFVDDGSAILSAAKDGTIHRVVL